MKMCSIYDSKSEAWMNPLFFQAVGQALRSFGDAVNSPDSEFGKHPEDYTLFLLGDFQPSTGVIELCVAPVAIATGLSVATASGGDR